MLGSDVASFHRDGCQKLIIPASLIASLHVLGPGLGQIHAIGDRQARAIAGDRKRNGHLAIVLLAELPAVLPRHTDRMFSLFRKPRVIDDPRRDRAVRRHRRHDVRADLGQHGIMVGGCTPVVR